MIRCENIGYSENISEIQRLKLSDVKCQVFYTVLRKQELSDSDRSDWTLQFFIIELITQRFDYKTMKKVTLLKHCI